MLKVLHFYKTYYPDSFGGIEQVIFQLSEGTANFNVENTVLVLSPRGDTDVSSFHKHNITSAKITFELASTPFSLNALTKFKKLAEKADIIHYHFPYPFMDLIHFLAGVKKPTVVSYHSDVVKQKNILKFYKPLMHKFLGSVSRIVASSPNYVQTSPVLQCFRDKVSVIPFGIDEQSYPPVNDEKLAFWSQQFSTPFFLFIGAFRYYKGLHILLAAAKNASYPIVIIGGGPAEAELKQQAAELALDNVFFVGALEDADKFALLKLCHGLVFPSHLRSEAFGISLLEGAMFGKPLISCEIGTGTTYINIHNETGIVIEPNNVGSLRNAMDLLANNSQLAAQLGENAYKRYKDFFTYEQMINKYMAIYNDLSAKR
jgi:glycosyltransferase involved in cell wall biosynthesis